MVFGPAGGPNRSERCGVWGWAVSGCPKSKLKSKNRAPFLQIAKRWLPEKVSYAIMSASGFGDESWKD